MQTLAKNGRKRNEQRDAEEKERKKKNVKRREEVRSEEIDTVCTLVVIINKMLLKDWELSGSLVCVVMVTCLLCQNQGFGCECDFAQSLCVDEAPESYNYYIRDYRCRVGGRG